MAVFATIEAPVSGVKDGGDLVPRHGRDGRPKIFPKGGGKGEWYTRTTTFIDCLDDKSNLSDWKLRNLIRGIDTRPALMDEYRAIEDPEGQGKQEVNRLVSKAMELAGSQYKADLGTALHTITEDIDAGKDPGFIPPDFEKDIAAYIEATKDLEVVGIETFCVLDEYKVAGTFDRLVRVHGELALRLGVDDGTLMVADIKTGGIEYGIGKIAMQLAAYQMMERYNPETYERTPLTHNGERPHDGLALIIHLPSGEGMCQLVPVDIATGRRGLGLAELVREWRKHWGRKGSKHPAIRTVYADGLRD